MANPTAAQAAALALLAKGDAYRWEHSGTWYVVACDDTAIPKATVTSLLKRRWAEYGEVRGVRRPLSLTEAGQALAADTAEK